MKVFASDAGVSVPSIHIKQNFIKNLDLAAITIAIIRN